MNILLKEFQEEAVADFVRRLRKAAREAREGDLQAVSLSSPTGSGKTVILIAAIERLLQGDDEALPDPEATFLWITDQPELNLQTRDKMLAFSTVLASSTLTVLDTDFDAERLAPGQVYFLNTQKLGRNSLLVAAGDRRTFTMWETIAATARERPGSFYVIVDEAHRGMAQSTQARNEANSIIQKFILGSEGEIPPIPLIVGISATLQRFNKLIEAAQRSAHPRTSRPIVIEAAAVRASGLIKDAIQFVHPTENQQADMTLLREAVKSWLLYRKHWSAYCKEQGLEPVEPILTVQVEDARGEGGAVSRTDLAQAIAAIEAEAGTLPDTALAHAFQDRAELPVAGRRLRHIPPSEISADPDVRVVFFKTSLTTGWDCPRAEVMMSFRTAADATHIAQLVGRMVRTPMARRVEADEHLNTVALYLPHYDADGLTRVIGQLTDPDSDLVPPTEIRTQPVATLARAEGGEALFAALEALPSYSVPRAPSPNETRRLMKLARSLSRDGLYPDAPEKAVDRMLSVMDAAFERVRDTPPFKAIVDERDTLDIRLVSYLYGEEDVAASADRRIPVSPENVADLFDAAGRRMGEGLYKEWWRRRTESAGLAPGRVKLEFVALATADLKRDLDAAAKKQAQTWFTLYREQIRTLPENRRQAYDEIQGLAADPEIASLVYPDVIEAKIEGETWQRHLYVSEQGGYPAKLNNWEAPVIREELKRPDLRGWLRVVPRKPWALTIPYRVGATGKVKPVYIDFLIVRAVGDGLVVDIVDPHMPDLGDAADKLAGLAEYAARHGAAFGRIESIVLAGEEIRRLNLQDPDIREKAGKARTSADVLRLFERYAVVPPTG